MSKVVLDDREKRQVRAPEAMERTRTRGFANGMIVPALKFYNFIAGNGLRN